MRKLPPAAFELDDAVRLKQEIAAAAFAFRRRIPFPNLRYQHETYPNEGLPLIFCLRWALVLLAS